MLRHSWKLELNVSRCVMTERVMSSCPETSRVHIVSCRLERVACVNLCLTAVDINVPVITCHASKQSSKMAMEGDYEPSRLTALMCQRLVARNTYVYVSVCQSFFWSGSLCSNFDCSRNPRALPGICLGGTSVTQRADIWGRRPRAGNRFLGRGQWALSEHCKLP